MTLYHCVGISDSSSRILCWSATAPPLASLVGRGDRHPAPRPVRGWRASRSGTGDRGLAGGDARHRPLPTPVVVRDPARRGASLSGASARWRRPRRRRTRRTTRAPRGHADRGDRDEPEPPREGPDVRHPRPRAGPADRAAARARRRRVPSSSTHATVGQPDRLGRARLRAERQAGRAGAQPQQRAGRPETAAAATSTVAGSGPISSSRRPPPPQR